MNEQDTTHPGSEVASMPEHGTAVRLDQGHVVGDGGLPERFTNPGLPAHVARMADLDEAAARRAEKQVSTLFGISIVGALLFIVFYFAISLETTVFVPGIGLTSASNLALGATLALSPARHRLRRGALGQDAHARRGDRRGAAHAARHATSPATGSSTR